MAEINLATLQGLLADLVPQGRSGLLPALHATQSLYGYVPEAAAAEIAAKLGVPLADVYGVIDFYTLFQSEPVGKTVLHVCEDPACAMAGAEGLFKTMRRKVEGNGSSTVTVERAPCLGLCEHAPALLVQGAPVGDAATHTWEDLVAGKVQRPGNVVGGDVRILTANCGHSRPTTLAEYEQSGGYAALRRALEGSPGEVIETVKASGLVGRGGAAFPTGVKWEGAARAEGQPKYVICNGDEAEPGTFKDRVLMEEDPHRPLEGLILAAYATGAEKGYWYIRGEYTYPYEVVRRALTEARKAGYLGENILGSSFSFEVELRRGAGAYICGEETALFEFD